MVHFNWLIGGEKPKKMEEYGLWLGPQAANTSS